MRGIVAAMIVVGVIVAFRAGARWRQNSLTWSDHRVARGKAQGLQKARWTSLKLAAAGLFVLLVYLVVTGTVGLAITTGDKKPGQPSPSPCLVDQQPHASCASTAAAAR